MSYSVRCVPETPSASLNSWLTSRYSEPTSNVVQYVISSVICAFYEAATAVHRAVLRARGNVDSKTAWMAACGFVGVAVTIAAWLVFRVIMASSFIFQGVLHYTAVLAAIAGLGLGAAGALCYSGDVEPTTTSRGEGGAGSEYQYHSTSRELSRSHDD